METGIYLLNESSMVFMLLCTLLYVYDKNPNYIPERSDCTYYSLPKKIFYIVDRKKVLHVSWATAYNTRSKLVLTTLDLKII